MYNSRTILILIRYVNIKNNLHLESSQGNSSNYGKC